MADGIPARMYLIHLRSGHGVSAQFNPTQLKETFESVWENLEVQGASGEESHYSHTRNPMIDLTMNFDAQSEREIDFYGELDAFGPLGDVEGLRKVRRFLAACHYVPRGGSDIESGSPSRVLFVWPKLYSLVCRLKKTEIEHTEFEEDGNSSLYVAKLSVEGVHFRRLYYEDVLNQGMVLDDANNVG